MGSLGEEAFEKLVIDYMELESPVIASDDLEKPSSVVLITLQVYIYSHPFFNAYLSLFFCIKLNITIFTGCSWNKRRKREGC